ncbi:MAG: hypothetical protein H0X51_00075 [Parachlamydiaceae bacterium]|nr:hypothetical protein [Parachlamydiaceae bacterium]
MTNQLLRLSTDLILNIASFVDIKELCRFRQSNKLAARDLTDDMIYRSMSCRSLLSSLTFSSAHVRLETLLHRPLIDVDSPLATQLIPILVSKALCLIMQEESTVHFVDASGIKPSTSFSDCRLLAKSEKNAFFWHQRKVLRFDTNSCLPTTFEAQAKAEGETKTQAAHPLSMAKNCFVEGKLMFAVTESRFLSCWELDAGTYTLKYKENLLSQPRDEVESFCKLGGLLLIKTQNRLRVIDCKSTYTDITKDAGVTQDLLYHWTHYAVNSNFLFIIQKNDEEAYEFIAYAIENKKFVEKWSIEDEDLFNIEGCYATEKYLVIDQYCVLDGSEGYMSSGSSVFDVHTGQMLQQLESIDETADYAHSVGSQVHSHFLSHAIGNRRYIWDLNADDPLLTRTWDHNISCIFSITTLPESRDLLALLAYQAKRVVIARLTLKAPPQIEQQTKEQVEQQTKADGEGAERSAKRRGIESPTDS